jgi:hypothetical protein
MIMSARYLQHFTQWLVLNVNTADCREGAAGWGVTDDESASQRRAGVVRRKAREGAASVADAHTLGALEQRRRRSRQEMSRE